MRRRRGLRRPRPSKKKRGKAELRAQLEGETDPYRLLELEELRWRCDAGRRAQGVPPACVLLHHPDKQDAAKAKAERAEAAAAKARDADGDAADDDDADAKKADDDEDEGDEMFQDHRRLRAALQSEEAPRLRLARRLRRLDPARLRPGHRRLLQAVRPRLRAQLAVVGVQPAPLLGDASAPFDDVAEFYNFWFAFKSWRDFADADEYDVGEAGFREEKRWMEREN